MFLMKWCVWSWMPGLKLLHLRSWIRSPSSCSDSLRNLVLSREVTCEGMFVFLLLFTGRTLMRQTLFQLRRRMWSVHKLSFLSMRSVSPGILTQLTKRRRRMRKTRQTIGSYREYLQFSSSEVNSSKKVYMILQKHHRESQHLRQLNSTCNLHRLRYISVLSLLL